METRPWLSLIQGSKTLEPQDKSPMLHLICNIYLLFVLILYGSVNNFFSRQTGLSTRIKLLAQRHKAVPLVRPKQATPWSTELLIYRSAVNPGFLTFISPQSLFPWKKWLVPTLAHHNQKITLFLQRERMVRTRSRMQFVVDMRVWKIKIL